jgi:hypothetical protein
MIRSSASSSRKGSTSTSATMPIDPSRSLTRHPITRYGQNTGLLMTGSSLPSSCAKVPPASVSLVYSSLRCPSGRSCSQIRSSPGRLLTASTLPLMSNSSIGFRSVVEATSVRYCIPFRSISAFRIVSFLSMKLLSIDVLLYRRLFKLHLIFEPMKANSNETSRLQKRKNLQ